MFEYKTKNNRTIYITVPEAIASYMTGFYTKTLSKEDFQNWSAFLKDFLSDNTTTAYVISGEEALAEIDRDDYMFIISDNAITLKNCYDQSDLDKLLDSDRIPDDEVYMKLKNAPIEFREQATESEM